MPYSLTRIWNYKRIIIIKLFPVIKYDTQYIDEEGIADDDYFDEQDLRVINILAPGLEKTLEDIPSVSNNTVKKYYN